MRPLHDYDKHLWINNTWAKTCAQDGMYTKVFQRSILHIILRIPSGGFDHKLSLYVYSCFHPYQEKPQRVVALPSLGYCCVVT